MLQVKQSVSFAMVEKAAILHQVYLFLVLLTHSLSSAQLHVQLAILDISVLTKLKLLRHLASLGTMLTRPHMYALNAQSEALAVKLLR